MAYDSDLPPYPDLNHRPLPIPQPPTQAHTITIQDLIMLRINLDQCPTKTADLKASLANLDRIILTYTSGFAPTLNPGAPKP